MRSLARAALLVTVVTLASRIVGFGRWLAQGYFVGNGTFTDAFNAANLLPNVLFEVAAGGALAGAVVPLVSGPLSRAVSARGDDAEVAAQREQASRSASALLGWTLVVLAPGGALMAILAGPIAAAMPLDDPGMRDVVAAFLRVFAVQVPMYGLAVVLGGILQAHKRFFWPAFSPLISSLVVIIGYWAYSARLPEPGVQDIAQISTAAFGWLAWGITAGVVALALPLMLPVVRTGLRLRPTLRFPDGEGRRAARLAFAGVGALVAQQLALVVVMYVGTELGGYTTWLWAYNVYLMPYAVLAYPIATSAFPHFAEHAAAGRRTELNSLVAGTTRTLLVVASAGVAALIAAAVPVERVFDVITSEGGAPGLAAALAWLAPGMIGYALILHLSRALYAVDRGRAAVLTTATGWAVMALGLVVVRGWLTSPGMSDDGGPGPVLVLSALSGAVTVGMFVAGAGLLDAVRRHLGATALTRVGRTLVALAVGVSAGALAGHAVQDALVPDVTTGAGPVATGFDLPGLLAAVGTGLLAGLVAAAVVLVVAALAVPDVRARLRRGLRGNGK